MKKENDYPLAKILVVDDDTAIGATIVEFLEISGFHARAFDSPEEALAFLDSGGRVDVVITDIMMPGIDGLELTERIIRDYDSDVIVMTGYSGDYSYEDVIRKGASDLVFKPVRLEELVLRINRVLRERGLAKERARMMEKLKKLAITDGLTKLYNSRHFYNQLDLELDRCRRYDHPLSLLLLDIDRFKEYNDAYGHLEGDKVLIKIGRVITNCLRKMDTAYRYGGEEFTVLLPETRGEEAVKAAVRISERLGKETFTPVPGVEVKITVSTGVAEFRKGESAADFVQRADSAMYLAKNNGRNRITAIFDDGSPQILRL